MIDHTPPIIRFTCEADSDAERVKDILRAVGFKPIRTRSNDLPRARQARALAELAKRHLLSRRECDVLLHLAAAHNNQQIADALDIARATAKWHVHNVFAKMKCTNTAQVLALIVAEVAGES